MVAPQVGQAESGIAPATRPVPSGRLVFLFVFTRTHFVVERNDDAFGLNEQLHIQHRARDSWLEDVHPLTCVFGALSPHTIPTRQTAKDLARIDDVEPE